MKKVHALSGIEPRIPDGRTSPCHWQPTRARPPVLDAQWGFCHPQPHDPPPNAFFKQSHSLECHRWTHSHLLMRNLVGSFPLLFIHTNQSPPQTSLLTANTEPLYPRLWVLQWLMWHFKPLSSNCCHIPRAKWQHSVDWPQRALSFLGHV